MEGVGQYPDSVYHMHVGKEELHPQIIKQVGARKDSVADP